MVLPIPEELLIQLLELPSLVVTPLFILGANHLEVLQKIIVGVVIVVNSSSKGRGELDSGISWS